jgi:hypothetical protein
MKTFIYILLATITLISQGQQCYYSDWIEFNLKENPKSVREISLLSFSDYTKEDFLVYFNNSLKWNFELHEYYFDTIGFISKEFHKYPIDTLGYWRDYSTKKILQDKDSIIITFFDSDGYKTRIETRYLDKYGFISRKIDDCHCPDTVIYTRDFNNRIIKEYRNWYCIDYGQKIYTDFELNDNGDIKYKKEIIYPDQFECEEPCSSILEEKFEYNYDSNGNWIIKITYMNNEILSITQREINY